LLQDAVPEPADFVMADYAQKVIEIFDGEEQDMGVIYDNELMKSVIDKFGENVHTEKINDEQVNPCEEVLNLMDEDDITRLLKAHSKKNY
jgi:2-iminoacetate synthase ThiH